MGASSVLSWYSFTSKERPNWCGSSLLDGQIHAGEMQMGQCRWACRSLAPCGSVAGGVMKSCSFSSFCERAKRDGSRAPGVSVQCCYSNNCNAKSLGSRVSTSSSYFSLLLLCLCWQPLLKLTWGGRTRSWSNKSAFLEKGDCTF